MAEQVDLPSDSDASDVDFKLSDEESLPSEEESDGSVEEAIIENENQQNEPTKKRKKKLTKRRKKMKKDEADSDEKADNDKTVDVPKLTVEEEKKKTDSLWSDFVKECPPPSIRKRNSMTLTGGDEHLPCTNSPQIEKENNAVVTEIFEFAGEKVIVEKKVPEQPSGTGRGGRGRSRGGGGGLASLVGQLGKKNKLSTLEKSKLDWDRFKKDQGITEDLQTHNKGKEGYLEKQDFLQRTDLRQFEIEKQLRTTSRSNR